MSGPSATQRNTMRYWRDYWKQIAAGLELERDEARAEVVRLREATPANASACPHICNQCMSAELGTPRA